MHHLWCKTLPVPPELKWLKERILEHRSIPWLVTCNSHHNSKPWVHTRAKLPTASTAFCSSRYKKATYTSSNVIQWHQRENSVNMCRFMTSGGRFLDLNHKPLLGISLKSRNLPRLPVFACAAFTCMISCTCMFCLNTTKATAGCTLLLLFTWAHYEGWDECGCVLQSIHKSGWNCYSSRATGIPQETQDSIHRWQQKPR